MLRGLCTLITLLALAAIAVAGPKQDAKRHVTTARKLFEAGKYDAALTELLAANKLDPKPDLLFAIAQAYAKLGNCTEAKTYFEKFGKAAKTKQAASVVKEAIAACVPKEPAPPIEPAPSPPPPPPPLPTPPASEAPAPAAEPPPPPPPPPPSAPVALAPSRPAQVPRVPEPTSRPWYTDKLGDALVLTGVASTTVGLFLYQRASSDLDAAEASGSLAGYQQLVDNAHGMRNQAIALWAGGSVLVIAGIVRYALSDRSAEPSGVAIAPARGGGAVIWSGRF